MALGRCATCPPSLPADAMAPSIRAGAPSTPLAARARAIRLVMAHLGVRGRAGAGRRWRDLHGHTGTRGVSGPRRRATRLPRPQEGGEALGPDLACARPPVTPAR